MPLLALVGLLLTLFGAGLIWFGSRWVRVVGWVLASVGGLALLVALVSIATSAALGEPVG